MPTNRSPVRPQVDLTPVLGLVAILIPMLLMAYMPHVLSQIETTPPAISCCDKSTEDEVVVPRVQLTAEGFKLAAVIAEPGGEPDALELPCESGCRGTADYDWDGLQEVLLRTRRDTLSSGVVTILPDERVEYELVVATMDACRERRLDSGESELLYPSPRLASAL